MLYIVGLESKVAGLHCEMELSIAEFAARLGCLPDDLRAFEAGELPAGTGLIAHLGRSNHDYNPQLELTVTERLMGSPDSAEEWNEDYVAACRQEMAEHMADEIMWNRASYAG